MKFIKHLIMIFLILIFSVGMSYAARFTWSNFGYSDCHIISIAQNPLDNTFYGLGFAKNAQNNQNDSFIFRSKDSLKSWIPVNQINPMYGGVTSIELDTEGRIYIIGGAGQYFIRSDDNGQTFEPILSFNKPNQIITYAIDLNNNIYLSALDSLDSPTIYFTNNNGESWDSVRSPNNIEKIVPDRDETVYLLSKIDRTYEVNGVYRYLKSSTNKIYKLNLTDRLITQLIDSYSDTNPLKVFDDITIIGDSIALLEATEYYFEDNIWSRVEQYQEKSIIRLIDKDGSFDRVVNISLPQRSSFGLYNQPYFLSNYGNNRLIVFWNNTLFSLETANDSLISLKTEPGIGLSRKNIVKGYPDLNILTYSNNIDDAGHFSEDFSSVKKISYKPLWINPYNTAYSTNDKNLIVADTSNKIYRTEDMGLYWEDLTYNMPRDYKVKSFAHTANGNLVAGTEKNGIFYQTNNGLWEERNNGLLTTRINRLAVSSSGEVFVLTDVGVYISDNECISYRKVTLEKAKEIQFVVNGFLLVTNDGKLIKFTTIDNINYTRKNILTEYYITSITKNSKGILLVSAAKKGILKSTDEGSSWFPANNYQYSEEVLQLFSTKDDEFIACSRLGMYYSKQDAEIWERNSYPNGLINRRLPDGSDEYTLIQTPNSKFFCNWNNSNNFICVIDKSIILPSSGWDDKIKYSEEKLFMFSSIDSKWVFPFDSLGLIYSFYDNILTKINLNSGIVYWERLFQKDFFYDNTTDIDVTGTYLVSTVRNKNNQSAKEIYFYNILTDSVIKVFKPSVNQDELVTYCNAKFDNSGKQLITVYSGIDTTKGSGQRCSVGEIQYRKYNTEVIDKISLDGIISSFFSADFTKLLMQREEVYKKTSPDGKPFYTSQNKKWYLLDLITRHITLIDTSLKYSDYPEFSPDNLSLIFVQSDGDAFVFDLSKSDSTDYLKPRKDTVLTTNFAYYDNNSVLTTAKNNKFVLYNFKDQTILRKSYHNYGQLGRMTLINNRKQLLSEYFAIKVWDVEKLLSFIDVDFITDISSLYVDDTISLSASEYPVIYKYQWDFGDGLQGYGPSIKHSYSQAGRYTVKLTTLTSDGDSIVIEKKFLITVFDRLSYSGEFKIASITGTIPLNVTLNTNIKGNFANFRWDLGNGFTKKDINKFTYKYYQPGEYTIKFIISDSLKEYVFTLDPKIVVTETISPILDTYYPIFEETKFSDCGTYNVSSSGKYTMMSFMNPSYTRYMMYFDSKGNEIWKRHLFDSINRNYSIDTYYKIYPTKDDGFYAVATIPNYECDYDYYSYQIKRIDSSGNLLWYVRKDDHSTYVLRASELLSDNRMIVLEGRYPKVTLFDEGGKVVWSKPFTKKDIYYSSITELKSKLIYTTFTDAYSFSYAITDKDLNIIDSVSFPNSDIIKVFDVLELNDSLIFHSGRFDIAIGSYGVINYRTKSIQYFKRNFNFMLHKAIVRLNDTIIAVTGLSFANDVRINLIHIDGRILDTIILSNRIGDMSSMYLNKQGQLILTGTVIEYEGILRPYIFITKPVTFDTAYDEKAGVQENDLRVYPNPAEDEFNVEYEISRGGYHKLSLTNSLGMESCVLSEGNVLPGEYRAEFSIAEKNLTSGIYFLRLLNDNEIITEKIIILK